MVTIFFRTIIIYLLLVGMMRLMGKRQIGEMDLSELITTLLLSELAVTPINNNNIPLAYAILPIVIIIALEIFFTFSATKFSFMKLLFNGKPSYIVKKGMLDQTELSRLRLSLDEFIGELRLKNVSDISEVEYAVLERNGRLSVFTKTNAPPPAPNPDGTTPEKGISHPLVVDGTLSQNNLTLAGVTREWVLSQLAKKKCPLDEAFLFAVDDTGTQNLVRKYKPAKGDG